uniref:Uncharacterized protein n=1 Tax=Arundo donax TaxID=35708 RepID=A0A0A8Y1R4_ARUDO
MVFLARILCGDRIRYVLGRRSWFAWRATDLVRAKYMQVTVETLIRSRVRLGSIRKDAIQRSDQEM